MIAGQGGIVFDALTYVWQPAYEESGFSHSHRRGFTSVQTRAPKIGVIKTPGNVIFRPQDATLVGAQIIAGTVSDPLDGRFRTIPAYATQESHSLTIKKHIPRAFKPGNSTIEKHAISNSNNYRLF